MKKIKELIKNDNFIVILILFLIFIKNINIAMQNADEVWVFSNVFQMYKGFEIYKDLNIIVTPLFFYIIEFIFKVFLPNFLVFRLCNIIINVALYFIIYNISKKIINNKKRSFLYTMLIFLVCKDTLNSMCSYNTLAILFFMIGIWINLHEKKYKNIILQGLIVFIIFMTKQNIGLYYILALFLNYIFYNKFKKEYIIYFIKIIFIFIIMFLIYCMYLYLNNNLYNFINYCFLGISDFNNNLIFDFRILYYLFVVGISVILVIATKNNINKKIITLELFSIPLSLMAYPIFNEVHIGISIIGIICVISLILDEILIKEIINEKITNYIVYIMIIVFIIISIFNIFSWISYVKNKEYIHPAFFGNIFEEKKDNELNLEDNIINITNYIKNNNKKTIALSSYAKMYAIVLDYNNGEFDLPFIGNLGKEGENGLINKISKLKDVNILLEKDEKNLIFQEPFKARNYIKNNYKKIGEIEQFEIYEN